MSDVVLGVGFNLADALIEARRVGEAIETELERAIRPNVRMGGVAAGPGVGAGVGAPVAGRANGVMSGLGAAAGGLGGAAMLGGGLLLGGVFGASAAFDMAAGVANLGKEVRVTTAAFEAFMGGADAAAATLDVVVEASENTVDRMEAMRIANRATALGMAETAEELERVTKFARVASAVLGGDVATTLDNLALAASNLSYERLDQMGISASRVRARVKELTESNKELSKEQAFLQASLEVGEKAFEDVASTLENTTGGVDRLRVAINNLRYDIAAGPIGQRADSFFTMLADAVEFSSSDKLTRQAERLKLIAQVYQDSFIAADRARGAEIQRLLDLLPEVDRLASEGAEGMDQVRERVIELAREIDNSWRLNDNMIDSVNRQVSAVELLASSWTGVTTEVMKTATQVGIAEEKLKATAAAIRESMTNFEETGSIYGVEQRQSPSYGGYDYGGVAGGYDDRRAELERQSTEERMRAATEASIARSAEEEWKRATAQMTSEWERQMEAALRNVEGLFDSSGVTSEDLLAAEEGKYQEKADEFVRRFADQVINGVDRGIDVEDVRQRVGLGPEATARDILDELRRQWDTSELFAGGENLDLINRAAVEQSLQRQRESEEGERAIAEYFGLTLEKAGFTSEGISEAVAQGVVAGQQTYASGGTPEEASSYVQGVATGMEAELNDDDMIEQLQNVGRNILALVHGGFVAAAPEFEWVSAIVSAAKTQAEGDIAALTENPDVA